jgi:hypothetical protein
MKRRYKTRYFAPDIQIREQQLPIQKNENKSTQKQARLLIRNANDCGSMNDFAEIPQRHHPGNHLGQKGWVSCYCAWSEGHSVVMQLEKGEAQWEWVMWTPS